MSDKFRRVEPVNITFSNGEQPTAAKLRASVTQSRNGSQLLERAIGDLWNQSGDPTLNAYPIQINNLARTIGQIRYMNPVMYRTAQAFTYIDSIGANNTGRTDGFATFKPNATPSIVGGSTAISNVVASEALVVAAGDIYVDLTTGKFRSFSPLTTNDKISYVVDSDAFPAGFEQFPSIIPDPRQQTFTGCRVSFSGGKYYLHLPPRRPLNITGNERPDRYPALGDYTANEATSTSLPRRLWQYATSALADEHYRYSLPNELRLALGGMAVGDSLPSGFMYLYDNTTGTTIEDVIFKKTADLWVFEISSASTDFSSKATASEVQANYNSTNYTIMTTGTSIARAIQIIEKKLGKTSAEFMGALEHNQLKYLNPSNATNFPASGVIPSPSRWGKGDDHSQYLSRIGSWGTGDSTQRDTNDNAMLGDLVLSSEFLSGGNYLNKLSNSRKIYFGKRDSTYLNIFRNNDFPTETLQVDGSLNVGNELNLASLLSGTFVAQQASISETFGLGYGFNVYLFVIDPKTGKEIYVNTFNIPEISSEPGTGAQWSYTANPNLVGFGLQGRVYVENFYLGSPENNPPYQYWNINLDNSESVDILNSSGLATGEGPAASIPPLDSTGLDSIVPKLNFITGDIEGTNVLTTATVTKNRLNVGGDLTARGVTTISGDLDIRTLGFNNNIWIGPTRDFNINTQNNGKILNIVPSGIAGGIQMRKDNTFAGSFVTIDGSSQAYGGATLELIPRRPGGAPSDNYGPLRLGTNFTTVSGNVDGMVQYNATNLGGAGQYFLGDGLLWNKIVTRNLVSAANSAAVTATATETVFAGGLHTIPTNSLRSVGSGYRIRCTVQATATNSTDTLTVRIRHNTTGAPTGTVLFSSGAVDVANGDYIIFDVWIVWDTTGSTGQIRGGGSGFIGAATSTIGAGTMKALALPPTGVSANFRTDQARYITVSAQWSTTNAGNSCRMESLIIEQV